MSFHVYNNQKNAFEFVFKTKNAAKRSRLVHSAEAIPLLQPAALFCVHDFESDWQ
jgi:hypothetical protein